MVTLFIAFGALIAAVVVRSVLDPWAPQPGNLDTKDQSAADEGAQMMEAIVLSCF